VTGPRDIADRLRDADPDELRERISIEAERLAEAGGGPTALVAALLSLDRADLTPLAAERHLHAARERWTETGANDLAERSPILAIDGTLHAAPVGDLGEDGLARFVDRVLAAVLRQPPARVILHLDGFALHPGSDDTLAALERDLTEQGIELVRLTRQ
jgi:hypothetical protein